MFPLLFIFHFKSNYQSPMCHPLSCFFLRAFYRALLSLSLSLSQYNILRAHNCALTGWNEISMSRYCDTTMILRITRLYFVACFGRWFTKMNNGLKWWTSQGLLLDVYLFFFPLIFLSNELKKLLTILTYICLTGRRNLAYKYNRIEPLPINSPKHQYPH